MTKKIEALDELMFRQIHPSFVEDDGVPSSQPFRPTEKDNNKLSVDRSSVHAVDAAYDLFVAEGHQSAGVYGLTVGEFSAEQIPCFEDPIPATPASMGNDAHAVADYTVHSLSQQRKVAKRLKQAAVKRGRLHP